MTKRKIMTVYGTRPEAIKVAPVIEALESDPRFDSVAVVTGQHREMLDQVNAMFGITPSYDLALMVPGQSLNRIVARAIAGLDDLLERERPDAVIVQGDTSTAMAAAIAAFNRRIDVVHLEAGLRTGDIDSPFPEEANRKLITQVARLHLAPTQISRDNLVHEAVAPESIVVTGNTVIDALLEVTARVSDPTDPAVAEALHSGRPVVLVTTHRRENLGHAMESIGRAIRDIALRHPDHVVVVPIHKNPIVRQAVLPAVQGVENVLITEPLSYLDFTRVMSGARIILTDSGGVQEEAPSLGKPVLVMRDNTERPEAVTAGTVRLVGTDHDRIVFEATHLLSDQAAYDAMANAVNPYGDGRAAERAVSAIAELLGIGSRRKDFKP